MKTSWSVQLILLSGLIFVGINSVQAQQPTGSSYLAQPGSKQPPSAQQPMSRNASLILQAIENADPASPKNNAAYNNASFNNSAADTSAANSFMNAGGIPTDDFSYGSCGNGPFRFLKMSDECFDDFISPISNPFYFEDPRNLTEVKGVYLQNRVPQAAGGGAIQLYAVQLRAKLSENVSLICTKNGFFTSSNPVVDDGWADSAAGLKFNLLRDPQTQRLVSSGFTYELPSGEASALQGNGSGVLNLFISSGKGFLDNRAHWVSTSGARVSVDRVDESQSVYSSHHFDYRVRPRTWLLTEFNINNWTRAGLGGTPGVEGLDLYNQGSVGVAGNTIVTQAVGLKFKPHRNSEIGAAFEFPLTERRDIIDNRINVNWIWRY